VHGAAGGALIQRFRVTGTPTYLVLNATGEVVYRKSYGLPDSAAIKKAVSSGAAAPG
jgi:hypothetical protein